MKHSVGGDSICDFERLRPRFRELRLYNRALKDISVIRC
jgi:hypothetical protein